MTPIYSNPVIAPLLITAGQAVIGPMEVSALDRVSLSCLIGTFSAGTFAASSLAANAVTITAHGYMTGSLGQLTTAGSLPTGLSLSTNYYAIVIDANTIQFASSLANANAGTPIAISGGTGNSTFTPVALTGCTVEFYWANDKTLPQSSWQSLDSPVSVTAALNFGHTFDKPPFRYVWIVFTITGGSVSTSTTGLYTVHK